MKLTLSQLKILELIKDKGKISRKKMAQELNLTPAAITKSIELLLQNSIIQEIEYKKSTGGRRAINIAINSNWIGKILGISLTPTSVMVSVGTIDGKIFKTKRYEIEKNIDILDYLEKIIEYELNNSKGIKIVSIAITGLINSDTGIIIFSPHYKRKKIEIIKRLKEKFELVFFIENDVRAMAMSEKYFGCTNKNNNYVVLNVSEGIGSSIVANGKIVTGHGFISGEIGHVIMNRNSLRKCSCGKRGCLEAEASNKAIINKVVAMIKLNNYSFLKTRLKEKNELEIEDILDAVDKRDLLCTKICSEAIITIAHSIDMIISLINPEKIILVGKIFANELLFRNLKLELQKVTLEEQVYELVLSKIQDKMEILNPISIVRHNIFKMNQGGEI